MKIIKVLTVLFFTTVSFSSSASALVIDHACTDITQIPSEWVASVKSMVLINTGQSHGRQIPYGLTSLQALNSTYGVTVSIADLPAQTSALRVSRALLDLSNYWFYYIGVEEFWSTAAGLENVRRTLDYHRALGHRVDAILHTWCWHLRTWTAEQVNAYLTAMEALESEYPDSTFIYMTDTADSSGDEGYNRWLRNEQIRAYCMLHNKVLFDFGELETWSMDGTGQNTYYHSASGETIPLIHPDWDGDWYVGEGSVHISEDACIMKAKAIWWLMAKLAGWGTTSTTTTIADPNDFDGDGVPNVSDNCPTTPNPGQEDSYPPEGGNGCGDACECHADCDSDQKVNLGDLIIMKTEFMQTPVYADCNYDNKIDIADLVIMKNEMMRVDCPFCL